MIITGTMQGETLATARRVDVLAQQRWDGLISDAEAVAALDAIKVRGGFGPAGAFTGYDYAGQAWIEVVPN